MQTTTPTKKKLSPLQRFLGEDVRVAGSETVAVNNFIQLEWLEVCVPEEALAEDQCRLYLFPVEDNKFCL